MMKNSDILIFFICFLGMFPHETLLQRRSSSSAVYNSPNEQEYKTISKTQGIHWKSVSIIMLGVLILATICYGTNCLYICQITLCKGAESQYTKMDLTSQV